MANMGVVLQTYLAELSGVLYEKKEEKEEMQELATQLGASSSFQCIYVPQGALRVVWFWGLYVL